MKTPYNILEIQDDATDDEIKSAYRSKAKDTHPDKGGGEKDFQEVNEAYLILISPRRRKLYDTTGRSDAKPDVMLNRLAEVFVSVVLNPMYSAERMDLFEKMTATIKENLKKIQQERTTTEKHISSLERVRINIKGEVGFFQTVADNQIQSLKTNLSLIQEDIDTCEKMIAYVGKFEYTLPDEVFAHFGSLEVSFQTIATGDSNENTTL